MITSVKRSAAVAWRRPSPVSRAALLAKLRRRLPACVTEAYLFGSYARDEASAESDIDLILVAPSSRTFPDRFRDVPGLGKGLPPMDLMIYTPAEWRTLRAQPSSLLQVAMSEWVAVISSAPAVPPPRRFRSG